MSGLAWFLLGCAAGTGIVGVAVVVIGLTLQRDDDPVQ